MARARQELEVPESTRTARKQEIHKYLTSLAIQCSQIGDNRPVSCCTFSPDSSMIATASWYATYFLENLRAHRSFVQTFEYFYRSGLCKLWSAPGCTLLRTFTGHTGPAGCIAFHPHANADVSDRICALASCAHDGSVKLWNLDR